MGKYYPEFAGLFGSLLEAVKGRTVAVVGHARPDGDCIGAQVALARVLSARGSSAVCVNPDTVPRRLAYFSSRHQVHPHRGGPPPPGRRRGGLRRLRRPRARRRAPEGPVSGARGRDRPPPLQRRIRGHQHRRQRLRGLMRDPRGALHRRRAADRPGRRRGPPCRDHHRHRAVPLRLDLPALLRARGGACRPRRLAVGGRLRALRARVGRQDPAPAEPSSPRLRWNAAAASASGRCPRGSSRPPGRPPRTPRASSTSPGASTASTSAS